MGILHEVELTEGELLYISKDYHVRFLATEPVQSVLIKMGLGSG